LLLMQLLLPLLMQLQMKHLLLPLLLRLHQTLGLLVL
jgi:hypothetical protein